MSEVFVAIASYGPHGGFTALGVYPTEEKAWAALSKSDFAIHEWRVCRVFLEGPIDDIKSMTTGRGGAASDV